MIPVNYPLREISSESYAERTRANVRDSDATWIFTTGEAVGGTAETLCFCRELQRPHLLIDAARTDAATAAQMLASFMRERRIATLNVAGPRASEWRVGYNYVTRALELFFAA
jgi:hypothetical protein